MSFDLELLSNIAAIFKYAYKNPGVHKNTIRNDLVKQGKFATKEKFARAFESLVALGKLEVERDRVTVCRDFIETGLLQKKGDNFYLHSPNSEKRIKLQKNTMHGYEPDDIVDFMIERNGKDQVVFVLGKNPSPLARKVVYSNILSDKLSSETISKELQPESRAELRLELSFEPSTDAKPDKKTSNRILGRVVKINSELVFIPNDKHMDTRFIPLLHTAEELPNFENRICVLTLADETSPILGGKIIEVKGDAGNPIHEYDAIASEIGAKVNWDDEELQAEIDAIPTSIDLSGYSLISEEEAIRNHRGHIADLRHIPFCPTDPINADDKDDAIYSTYDEDGNFVVYAAVANLPRFIKPGSKLFEIYKKLSMTFYTPTRSYPVTHPKLSSGVCAFKQGSERFAFVTKQTFDKNTGKVLEQNLFDAVVNCKKEYAYSGAQAIVDSYGDDDLRTHFEWKSLTGNLLTLDEQVLMDFYTAQVLKADFVKRNRPNFSQNNEYRPTFTADQRKIVDIERVPHLPYNEVIEYFMLTANEATAKYAMDKGLDVAFRVHDAPSPKKIEGAQEFFDLLGITFDGNVSAKGLVDLLEIVKGTPAEEMVSRFLIKMQSRAVYSDHPYNDKTTKSLEEKLQLDIPKISHFALQSPGYCHSTAPIRRSPDYTVIYNILADIHGTEKLSKAEVQEIIEYANERQKVLDEAERDIELLNGVLYAIDHIGEKLHGTVTRLRYTVPEEEHNDEIVAVVKNRDKGVVAEIPLSQIIGKTGYGFKLSPHGNAVYDSHDNIVLKICQPLDFVIESADKLTMNVVGKTNKALVQQAGHSQVPRHARTQSSLTNTGKSGKKKKPYQPNKSRYKENHNQGKKPKNKKSPYTREDKNTYLARNESEYGDDYE